VSFGIYYHWSVSWAWKLDLWTLISGAKFPHLVLNGKWGIPQQNTKTQSKHVIVCVTLQCVMHDTYKRNLFLWLDMKFCNSYFVCMHTHTLSCMCVLFRHMCSEISSVMLSSLKFANCLECLIMSSFSLSFTDSCQCGNIIMQYLKFHICFRIKLFNLIHFAPEFVIEIMLSGVWLVW